MAVETKRCTSCLKNLPLLFFTGNGRGGQISRCRECKRIYNIEWYAKKKQVRGRCIAFDLNCSPLGEDE